MQVYSSKRIYTRWDLDASYEDTLSGLDRALGSFVEYLKLARGDARYFGAPESVCVVYTCMCHTLLFHTCSNVSRTDLGIPA